MLPQVVDFKSHVFHIFPIRCSKRDNLQNYLLQHEIQTIIHYPIPPHKQKCYKQWNHLTFPITEQIHAEELSIPLSPVMTVEEIEKVVEVINKYPNEN